MASDGERNGCTVEEAARRLLARFDPHVAALMAYGSRVIGQARTGSEFDFWLIVRDAEEFHRANAEFYRTQLNIASTAEKQVALNRSGPLFYSIRDGEYRIKVGVLDEENLARLCRSEWWTVKGRMQKPMRPIRMSPKVEEAVGAARREGAEHALNLVPARFTLEQFLTELVSLSYRAEVRPEHKTAKIRSIVETGYAELAKIYEPILAQSPGVRREGDIYVDSRGETARRRARKDTLRALRRSKWSGASLRFVWRNYRSHRTPIRYVVMKVYGEAEKTCRRWFRRK